ncbi:MAG TPA: hypothetical protein VJM76_00300 [Gammaproteobacteria bacterium]|nr:hypothetical protein [Gammaproteobacteria bacterium]
MNKLSLPMLCALTLLASGCATITSDEMQTLSLNTKTANGEAVEKANCSLKNDKGAWQVESPGLIVVHRSAEDLMIECKKEGTQDGFLRAVSRASGGMFGNIIFGGGIGAIIDHSKGTGYNYPDELPVKMGASTTVDRQQQNQQNNTAAQPSSASAAKN